MKTEAQLGVYEKAQIAKVYLFEKENQDTKLGSSKEKGTMATKLYEKLVIRTPFLLDEREAETITRIYLEQIAGVKLPKNVNAWWPMPGWRETLGKRMNGLKDKGVPPENGPSFWKDVNKKVPSLLTDVELQWLTENDPRGSGAFDFLFGIEHL